MRLPLEIRAQAAKTIDVATALKYNPRCGRITGRLQGARLAEFCSSSGWAIALPLTTCLADMSVLG